LAASCSKPPAPAVTREAFLPFDNLTGDASLDWIAQAAPRILERDLTGLPKTLPLAAAAIRDAYLQGATRLVHGYYEMRSGKLHFEIDVEDAAGHRMVQTVAEDGDFSEAMNRAARILSPDAQELPTPAAAVDAWGQGQYERAVMLDPDFGVAWLAWVEQIAASSNPDRVNEATETAERALARPGLRGPIDRARLELAAATLRQDDSARIAAMRKLVQLIPSDPSLLGTLAEIEMAARHFSDAARDFQAFTRAEPGNVAAKNTLGYAQAFAGDLDGARKSFEAYGQQPGQAINALDSAGEALFVNGKFDQAERAFLEAYQKDPAFMQATDLWKAAHARWLGGDLAGADRLMDQYLQARAKARDPLLSWRRANWLYETGRQEQAVQVLKTDLVGTDVTQPPQGATALIERQLQVWNNLASLPSDLATLEKDYRRSNPSSDGLVRVLYAEALVRAGRKDDARSLLKLWPVPEQNESPVQSLVYPKFIELRKELQP
jgi:tetratricopeptide (TPR) repeat protein